MHPTQLLATIYHAVGLNPQTIVYNHLNQPARWSRPKRLRR